MDTNFRNSNGSNISTGRLIGGGIIILLGLTMLLRLFGWLPHFRFVIHDGLSILLIAIGLLIGIRSNFRNLGAYVLIFIGAGRLIPVFPIGNGVYSNQAFWPLLFIALGLAVIFRKRGRQHYQNFTTPSSNFVRQDRGSNMAEVPVISYENAVNMDVTFGGRKEIITSKAFTGGRINVSFAGAEVNLAQADGPAQPMVLDIRVAFGSVELVVPSHWEVKNEINPTMGSVEDHRSLHTLPASGMEARMLVLRGSCTCGSVEVKSF